MSKYTKFFVRTYASKEFVIDVLEEHKERIKGYAVCYHDLDQCEPHTHFVLWLDRAHSVATVKKWFSTYRDSNGKTVNEEWNYGKVYLRSCVEYLTHINNPEKHQYAESDVVSYCLEDMLNNNYGFEYNGKVKEDKTFEILEKTIQGYSPYDLAKEYGRDYILNFRKYNDLAFACFECRQKDEEIAKAQQKVIDDELQSLYYTTEHTWRAKYEDSQTEIDHLRAMLHAHGIHDIDRKEEE